MTTQHQSAGQCHELQQAIAAAAGKQQQQQVSSTGKQRSAITHDVVGGAAGVLQGVADRVADDGGVVAVRPLAAQAAGVLARAGLQLDKTPQSAPARLLQTEKIKLSWRWSGRQRQAFGAVNQSCCIQLG